jgi:hypothetical protein
MEGKIYLLGVFFVLKFGENFYIGFGRCNSRALLSGRTFVLVEATTRVSFSARLRGGVPVSF